MGFQDKRATQKGNIGERIVRDHLEKKGYIVYEPVTDKSHAFDKFAVYQKRKFVMVEVKSKKKMTIYNATGFNTSVYEHYKFLRDKYKIPVHVYFVDEDSGTIYGNKLAILEENYTDKKGHTYPKTLGKVIVFSYERMNYVASLNNNEINQLTELTDSNW